MAIGIENYPNIVAADAACPNGNIKNDPGDGSGTPVNQTTNGDIHQFFAKLLRHAGITANNTPDNETNGLQYFDALLKTKPYKVFVGLLSYTGGSLIVLPLEDTITGIVFAKTSAGRYTATKSGAFDPAKTVVFFGNSSDPVSSSNAFYSVIPDFSLQTTLTITTSTQALGAADFIAKWPIEIRVYP